LARVIRSAGALVVGSHDGGFKEQKRGSSISNSVDGLRLESSAADFVSAAGEFPEAVLGVDGSIGNAAGMFRGVDVAEVIAAWCTSLQVGSKDGGIQVGFDVCKEGLLCIRGDGIDSVKCEADETVIISVLQELGADCLSELDCLAGGCWLADLDCVCIHIARRTTLICIKSRSQYSSSSQRKRGVKQVLKMPRNTSQGPLSHTQRGEKAPRSTNRRTISSKSLR